MKTFKGLPIYAINIDEEDTGMSRISLVEEPAVEVNFICFDEDKYIETLKFADEEKHCITGVVCLANIPIFRLDAKGRGYYIVFTEEVIEQMVLKYSKNNLWNSVSLQHDDKQVVDSVIMTEFYIKNTAKGLNPKDFDEVPEGSLFATFKVTDDDLWNEIKTSGKLNGFSLEIMANLDAEFAEETETQNDTEKSFDEEIEDLIK